MIYLQLAWVFFKIGLFGFGGGMAMISMIKLETVDNTSWLTMDEFSNILAIAQVTPGPISINTATYVGYTQGGIIGSIVSTFALVMPSVLLMFITLKLFFKYQNSPYVKQTMNILLPVVGGLIISASLMMFDIEYTKNIITMLIFVVTFVGNYFYKVSPIKLIAISGLVGAAM